MQPYLASLEKITLRNENFRQVLFTGQHSQLVVMCLRPAEQIGEEIHAEVDQFFRIEAGTARFVFRGGAERVAGAGDAVVIPAGTFHNVVNASAAEPLLLYTIYSPPQHAPGTVHVTKAEAMAAEHH